MFVNINGIDVEILNFSESNYNTVESALKSSLSLPKAKNRDVIYQAFKLAVSLAVDCIVKCERGRKASDALHFFILHERRPEKWAKNSDTSGRKIGRLLSGSTTTGPRWPS